MTKLVVLGILKRKPHHGYEIKSIIQKEMGDWTNIAFGSIYFALAQLAKEGFVSQGKPFKSASRPARIMYEITEKGEKEFMSRLVDVWKKHEHQYFPIDIGLFFSNFIKIEEMKKYLKKQMLIIRMALAHVKKHQDEELKRENVPPIAEAIFSHTLHHMRAEYHWLKEVSGKIADRREE